MNPGRPSDGVVRKVAGSIIYKENGFNGYVRITIKEPFNWIFGCAIEGLRGYYSAGLKPNLCVLYSPPSPLNTQVF